MLSQMRHTFVFRGQIELNPTLAPDACHYVTAKGSLSAIRQPKVDGLVFGFMEAPEDVVITQVDEIALDSRVPVNPLRHLDVDENEAGGRVGDLLSPNGKNISEDAARNALEDAMKANPGVKDILEPKRNKLSVPQS